MDRSRKANSQANEVTLQHQSPAEALLLEEQYQEKLAQLEASIEQSKQTPAEAELLEKRNKHFGLCQRTENETSGQFYARLRVWLDRELPQTKSPLHPPRQTGVE